MSNSLNYTYEDKKKIYNNIEKFKIICDKESLIYLAKIIISNIDKSKITEKKNGIWFDLCILNDDVLYKIDKYLKNFFKNNDKNNDDDLKTYVIKFNNNNISSIFSKKEKKIVDKIEKSLYQ